MTTHRTTNGFVYEVIVGHRPLIRRRFPAKSWMPGSSPDVTSVGGDGQFTCGDDLVIEAVTCIRPVFTGGGSSGAQKIITELGRSFHPPPLADRAGVIFSSARIRGGRGAVGG